MRRLFTSREVKEASEKQTEERIQVISFLTDEEARLKKSLNDLNDEFEASLKRQRAVYSEEKQRLQEELKELDTELAERREERKKLLVPVKLLEDKARARLEQADKSIAEAEAKTMEAAELIHNTCLKFTALEEKRAILDAEAESLSRKRKATDEEAEMVSRGHKRLNEEIAAFRETSAEASRAFSERQARLDAEIHARSVLLEEREKRIRVREEEIASEKKRLADERGVLDRAWKELRSNH